MSCRICGLPEERDGLCPGHREEWIMWAALRPSAQNDAGYEAWIAARVAELTDAVAGAPDCPACHGVPLPWTDGPDGLLHPVLCGVCTPLPPSVLAELDDDDPGKLTSR